MGIQTVWNKKRATKGHTVWEIIFETTDSLHIVYACPLAWHTKQSSHVASGQVTQFQAL